MSDPNVKQESSMRLDVCWYRVEYTAPAADNGETVYIAYVFDIPEAGEDSIRDSIYRQMYRYSSSLLKKEKSFPIEIKSITCVGKTYKAD